MITPNPDAIRAFAANLDPRFAENVSRWDVVVGEDWTGEPAIFVTIVLKDATIHSAWKTRGPYREQLFESLLREMPGYYPFIDFSAESDAVNPEKPVPV